MWSYATHGVGWGVIAFVTTARHDVMLRYAFVTTARHDGRLRYAWGGVGCSHMMWCYATHSSLLQDMMGGYATHDERLRYARLLEIDEKVNSRQHSFPSPRQTQWFVVQIHSKSPMEMGTHWLRLADRHWRSCKISHAVKRKDHFDRSPGFEAQNPARVANHTKTDVFFSWLFPTWNRAGATAKQ